MRNFLLHKMIGAGSRGGKLAIRANPLVVRQSLAQSAASVASCPPTVLVEGRGGHLGQQGEPLKASGTNMGTLASPKMAGTVGRGWTMERARRLAEGRQRPPKVYSSYSFQR